MRFDATAHRIIKSAAEACGVSQAQFVREAALIRAVLVLEQSTPESGEDEIARWQALSDGVRRLAALEE